MTPIKSILWAVQPGQSGTRPTSLVSELRKIGRVAPDAVRVYHGSTAPQPDWHPSSRLFPDVGRAQGPIACFSPVFGRRTIDNAAWFDAYDDWSIAPDINAYYRIRANSTYRRLKEARNRLLLTCNSPYMARKLGLPLSSVLPNAADESLANLTLAGDGRRRLILQGHFFPRRTDFQLMHKVATSGAFEEIVVCAPGQSAEMVSLLRELRSRTDVELRVTPWMTDTELASAAGPNTVAFIPHVVSDYTLSQDLMKAYKYLMLGLRVICPRLLWPEVLPIENVYLVDFGSDIEKSIPEWLRGTPNLDHHSRILIANNHSWTARAKQLSSKLDLR